VPGFILRAALSPRHANYKVPPAEPAKAALNLIEVSYAEGKGNTDFVPAFFHSFPTGAGVIASQNEKRRICAREAWFRNDKLRRIGILRKGDSIIVERYTDGAKDDKRPTLGDRSRGGARNSSEQKLRSCVGDESLPGVSSWSFPSH
jgi:hypothetical protein